MNNNPEKIFGQYREGISYKKSIGRLGIYEQSRINERFYAGDQWNGAGCGTERPLVRHNVIKRIGNFKMSHLAAANISINYFAEGLTNTRADREKLKKLKAEFAKNSSVIYSPVSCDNEMGMVVSALNSYREVTAARVELDKKLDKALRQAYITGSGVIYTYFDPFLKTGLYADKIGGTPILGDIVCENIGIENIYFADPGCLELQKQPYIILAERKKVEDIVFEGKRFGTSEIELGRITDEGDGKATLLTKLFKKTDLDGETKIFAIKVCENAVVRAEWDIGVRMYPIAIFNWESRNHIYGDSEVTYLIPNQIAINRMITAGVWATMSAGMPLMLVNGDLVDKEISNDPGQIIKVYGDAEQIKTAVSYVEPPSFTDAYQSMVNQLIYNTLAQSGANESSLGDGEANNTSAIIELREAAATQLTTLKHSFYGFVEDIARIWAEFFVNHYGKRCLKVSDENGVWYFPFDSKRYRDILFSVSVTAGDKLGRGEAETVEVLNRLLDKGAISSAQYLRRLPKGIMPDAENLAEEIEEDKI